MLSIEVRNVWVEISTFRRSSHFRTEWYEGKRRHMFQEYAHIYVNHTLCHFPLQSWYQFPGIFLWKVNRPYQVPGTHYSSRHFGRFLVFFAAVGGSAKFFAGFARVISLKKSCPARLKICHITPVRSKKEYDDKKKA